MFSASAGTCLPFAPAAWTWAAKVGVNHAGTPRVGAVAEPATAGGATINSAAAASKNAGNGGLMMGGLAGNGGGYRSGGGGVTPGPCTPASPRMPCPEGDGVLH